VDVLAPRSLADALEMRAARPDCRPLAGGTDVLVQLNLDHDRPAGVLDLTGVDELRTWRREGRELVLGAGITYTDVMESELAADLPALAGAARTVGSPQIRNRGTIGGNLGTASPAGDALPPLLVEGALVELRGPRGTRTLALTDFLVGPKRSALSPDELIVAVRLRPSRVPQTFMKIGPRNAMVIAVASLALELDRERGEVRVAFGSAAPTARLVTTPDHGGEAVAEAVAAAASPIDDVRGTAVYRRHALGVLARRAYERCAA
jgi:CO/xanthine dehydrogenase FAD-binding subunit